MELNELYAIIQERKLHPPEGSYTAQLLAAGEDKILKKVAEEAMEVILAGAKQGRQRLIEEISDLQYHLQVAMVFYGVTPEDIAGELEQRHRLKTG